MQTVSGPDAKSHDWAEGAGTFARALDNLGQGARTRVTRSNMRALVPIAELLRGRAPRWRLVCATVDAEPDPQCPRLSMAIPRVLHAAATAERAGIVVELEGFPRCLLGPWARLAVAAAPRELPERCGPCSLRPDCPGVDAAYLKRYGDAELRPATSSTTGDISSQPKRRR